MRIRRGRRDRKKRRESRQKRESPGPRLVSEWSRGGREGDESNALKAARRGEFQSGDETWVEYDSARLYNYFLSEQCGNH